MDRDHDINATYEGGVLRPDEPLAIPDHARVRITVHEAARTSNGTGPTRIDPTPEQRAAAAAALERLSQRGVIDVGMLPTRDQLYDRV